MFEAIWIWFEANGFNIFMMGWLVALAGAIVHTIGGGFKDGPSKVPVLGNYEEVKKGQKGFRQQQVAGWIFKAGFALVLIGGLLHFL
ncbi:hypothetical protein [Maritalea mediterranea]|uniref:Uncharacterized protein n=1 Tax=Maritalea mediterranea TaxID=2909667 RepID=A0ABS9ECQ4_9HYPH|nr:hypothetical protein [Maritalea mediterranea]MCF4099510.1 hypothetical protein [Maritalea mediterranea]